MKIVGLTGGIGSGKSTVADRLAQHGIAIIDADAIARQVVVAGSPVLAALVDEFGDEIVQEDGTLDRGRLAALAFASEDAHRRLEAITHPAINVALRAAIAAAVERNDGAVAVVDHPLLIETGQADTFDALIVVVAPGKLRRERLVADRGMAPADVDARMAAQTDDTTRRNAADWVIDNDGDLEALYRRSDEVSSELVSWARSD